MPQGMTPTREIPPSDDHLVWYAGYGSNLLRSRFDCYIGGGTLAGAAKTYSGCRDKTAIRGDRPITLSHQLYFADHSDTWGGAIAFIRRAASDDTTRARMYLITYGQFNDVVRQENGRSIPGDIIVPPYDDLAHANEWQIPRLRLYGRLMKIGTQDGHPILTFTATRDDFAIGAPSEAYIRMIAGGLLETYPCLYTAGILDYLAHAEGIRGAIDRERLSEWISGP
jgi:hypothetical protein